MCTAIYKIAQTEDFHLNCFFVVAGVPGVQKLLAWKLAPEVVFWLFPGSPASERGPRMCLTFRNTCLHVWLDTACFDSFTF